MKQYPKFLLYLFPLLFLQCKSNLVGPEIDVPVKFTDYEHTILNWSDIDNGFLGAMQAKVFYQNGKYRMWVNNLYQSHVVKVGYTESADGLIWNQIMGDPVLLPGAEGKWDDEAVEVGGLLYENGNFIMYYTGSQSSFENWNIGMAVSADGTHWEKTENPVIYATENEPQLHVDDVVKAGDKYYLYYTIRNTASYNSYSIGVATSTNGVNWIRSSKNPILTATKEWEGSGIYFPSVIYNSKRFEMIYMNSGNSFGIAYSLDGINWDKENDYPVFTKEDVNDKNVSKILYPFYRKFNGKIHIYYTIEHPDGSRNIRLATGK